MAIFGSTGKGGFVKPTDVLEKLMQTASGAEIERTARYSIFHQIVGFKGVKDGVGCSTIVANTALALARLGVSVCVVDTSIMYPSQDILLKTNYQDKINNDKENEILDWFAMGITQESVLNTSTINRKVSVLSFQNRTLTDLLGMRDSADLVHLAFAQLTTRFDVILVDLSGEPSKIAMTAMQLSQKVLQVWNNDETVLRSVERFLTNNAIMTCSKDKMRYVIINMDHRDVPTNWGDLLKKYDLRELTRCPRSMEISRMCVAGTTLFNAATTNYDVQLFNDSIMAIVCHILDIDPETGKRREYSVDSIIEGRNSEELQEKYKQAADYPELSQRAVEEQDGVGDENVRSGVYSRGENDSPPVPPDVVLEKKRNGLFGKRG